MKDPTGFETWEKQPKTNIWEKRIHNFDIMITDEGARYYGPGRPPRLGFEVTMERNDFPTLQFHAVRSDFATKQAERIAALLSARDSPGDFSKQ